MALWRHVTQPNDPTTYMHLGNKVLDNRRPEELMDAVKVFFPEHLFPRTSTSVCYTII
jgi:hypothetical protein